jgi:hypothetical protein
MRLIAFSVVSVEAWSPIHAGSTHTESERKAEKRLDDKRPMVAEIDECWKHEGCSAVVPRLHLGHDDWLSDCI